MNISYDEALFLIEDYGKGAVWANHCVAVSKLADRFAELVAGRRPLDVPFVKTAALLHDIGRYKTHDPLMHGVEGFHLLTGMGYHRHAFVCASHVLFGISRAEAASYGLPERDFIPTTFDERLIPVLDSLVECDRPTTISRRVESINRRYAGNRPFLERIIKAEKEVRHFISGVEAEFGFSMERMAADTLGGCVRS